ncbi:group I truncated hemoglobin [Bermanella marisrubri]|nr:group 1 truncated hemoglobin [Bermanella marisrubri]
MACSTLPNSNEDSLYERIGGLPTIEKLVDAFIKNIARDEQVLPYFRKSDVTHFRNGFIAHFCTVVDGPCEYKGDSMVDIHTGMDINEADFNRTVELLVDAMEKVGISYRQQNEILARLASLRKDIIHL